MRTVLLSLLALVVTARGDPRGSADGPPVGAPFVRLPAEVKAQPAAITEVKPETNCRAVRWLPLTAGLSLRPDCDGKGLLVSAPEGRYELVAYGALGDIASPPARTVVVVGGVAPKPPAPPADPLAQRLQAAFDADPAAKPAKAEALADLVELYRQAQALAADPAVATTGQLVERVRAAARALVIDGLTAVRKEVAAELAAALPNDSELTAELRTKATSTFARVHAALAAVR